MARRRKQILLTLVGGAVLLAATLTLTDQFAWDIFVVMLVPFVALALVRLRPALNWTLFVLIAVATILTLV